MSSFKRRAPTKQAALLPGTKSSPSSSSTITVSTGLPSLDDVLGGGLPLSCLLLVIAPDPHSSYGELVLKYFVAQGLSSRQNLCIIDPFATEFVKGVMWHPRSSSYPITSPSTSAPGEGTGTEGQSGPIEARGIDEDKASKDYDRKIKIAWRYEQMKQFQTTIGASSPSSEDFCQNFELTSRIPDSVLEKAMGGGQLMFLKPSGKQEGTMETFKSLSRLLDAQGQTQNPNPLRICIPSFGSPFWGDLTGQGLLHFLHSLRMLLRRFPFACALVTLPAHLGSENWGGSGWLNKLGWVSDGAISLNAFSGDPSLMLSFPSHHGFLRILSLPSPHTLLAPSDKFSTLRGLSSSSVSIGGGGENNLAFKCTRKRLVFETLHLDLEGGIGERRTTPSVGLREGTFGDHDRHHHEHEPETPKTALASVQVELEWDGVQTSRADINTSQVKIEEIPIPKSQSKPKKFKKKVEFFSDRPDVYDF